MSTVKTGLTAGPFVGDATCPGAGDAVTAASVQVAVQAVLDDAAFLNADKFSGASGGNITGATSFLANVDVNGFDLLIKNGSTFTTQATGNTTFNGPVTHAGADGVTIERTLQIGAATAATTVSVSYDTYYVDTPSVAHTWTVKSTVPVPASNTEIELIAYSTTLTKDVTIIREDLSTICVLGAAGYARCKVKFLGGVWRLAGIDGDTFTIGTP